MKAWIQRWLGIQKLVDPGVLFEKLQEAQAQHISDLRVLIDQGNSREALLVSTLQQTLAQGKSPRADRSERTENKVRPAVDFEHLSDVAVFDEATDTAESDRQAEKTDELQKKFDAIFAEQVTEGITEP